MNNRYIIGVLVIVAIGALALYVWNGSDPASTNTSTGSETVTPAAVSGAATKEFTMTSWMETTAEGKMSPHFSLSEMRVKKGDRVRITITNTAGTHDFSLDEFDIREETPLNEPVVVEFVADKAGSFEYYCSKYNHRQLGQRGTLVVEE